MTVKEAELEEDEYDFKIGKRSVNNLPYADDINPIAENTTDLQTRVIKVKPSDFY